MSDQIKQTVLELVSSLKNLNVSGIPEQWFEQTQRQQDPCTPTIPPPSQAPTAFFSTPSPLSSSITTTSTEGRQPAQLALSFANAKEQPRSSSYRYSPTLSLNQVPSTPLPAEVSSLGWDELEAKAKACTKCRLCETRTNVVFGVGKRESPLIAFVGEGPGADEDRLGEPFVGRAGALLTAAITKGLGLQREDVYIGNVVKCRPPQNRAPLPDEVSSCTPYLYRQLELLQPRVIITLGQPAQLALSGVNIGITKLRGQWQSWNGIKLMPTFHPAYLLRNPSVKRLFWEDLQAVMRELGLPVVK